MFKGEDNRPPPPINRRQCLCVVVNTEQVLTEQLLNIELKACVRGGVVYLGGR